MKAEISRKKIIDFYEKMNLIRKMELRIIDLAKKGEIFGNLHMYIGQEAIAVGAIGAIDKDDVITCGHRGIAHALTKGGEPNKIMAELMGRVTGCCQGRAGKMHLAIPEVGMMGAHGIVGAGIALATGMALHFKMNHKNNMAISFFGDGAVNHGYFHESINLACLWKLPILFICENNFYAISTHIKSAMSSDELISRAKGYKMPSICIDGMDVIEVYKNVRDCVKKIKDGSGPYFIEAKTYRFRGHHERDDLMYVEKKEIDDWIKKCPIKKIESLLLKEYKFNEEELNMIRQKIDKIIEEAVNFGLKSSFPDHKELFKYVYM